MRLQPELYKMAEAAGMQPAAAFPTPPGLENMEMNKEDGVKWEADAPKALESQSVIK